MHAHARAHTHAHAHTRKHVARTHRSTHARTDEQTGGKAGKWAGGVCACARTHPRTHAPTNRQRCIDIHARARAHRQNNQEIDHKPSTACAHLYTPYLFACTAQPQCLDAKFSLNVCSEWCNNAGFWPGCIQHTLPGTDSRNTDGADYTCSCAGCNGCSASPTPAPTPSPTPAPTPSPTSTTTCSMFVDRQLEFLDRQTLACSANQAMQSFRVVGCGGNDKRYEFACTGGKAA